MQMQLAEAHAALQAAAAADVRADRAEQGRDGERARADALRERIDTMQAEAATLQAQLATAEAEGDALTIETAELTAQVKAAKAEAREAQDAAEALRQAPRCRAAGQGACGAAAGGVAWRVRFMRTAGGNRACPRRSGGRGRGSNADKIAAHGLAGLRVKANAIGAVENHGLVEPFPPTLKFPSTCVTPTLWLIACTMAACARAIAPLLPPETARSSSSVSSIGARIIVCSVIEVPPLKAKLAVSTSPAARRARDT
jgi:hypothetical protein